MRLDVLLINTLIFDETVEYTERYRKITGLKFLFDERNKKVFDFVVSHYDQYRKLPDIQTLKDHFPAFDFAPPPEPFAFYIEEAKDFRREKTLREATSRIESILSKEGPKPAFSEFVSSAREPLFEEDDNVDLNLKKDIDSSIAEYQRKRDSEDAWGLCTGFSFLDNATLGLQPSDFWVLAARPKNFKTWMMCKMYLNIAAKKPGKFLLFSKEMPKYEIEGRLLSILGEFDYQKYLRYEVEDGELKRSKEALEESVGEAVIIGQEPGQSFDLAYIKSKIYQYEPALVGIDGLYLLSKSVDWKDVTDVTRKTRGIALDTGVPIFATWQLNKSGKKRQSMDDLAYADALSQDATAVIVQSRIEDEVLEKYTNTLDVAIVGSRRGPSEVKGKVSIGFKSMKFVEGEEDPDGASWSVDSVLPEGGIDV